MNIEVGTLETKLSNLHIGETFLCNGHFYMLTDSDIIVNYVNYANTAESESIKIVVDLETGNLYKLDDVASVKRIPLKAVYDE